MSITQHSHVIQLQALVDAYGKNLRVDGHGAVVRVESYVDVSKGAVCYIAYTQDEVKAKARPAEANVEASSPVQVAVPSTNGFNIARSVVTNGDRVYGVINDRPFDVKNEGRSFRVRGDTFAWLDAYGE